MCVFHSNIKILLKNLTKCPKGGGKGPSPPLCTPMVGRSVGLFVTILKKQDSYTSITPIGALVSCNLKAALVVQHWEFAIRMVDIHEIKDMLDYKFRLSVFCLYYKR